MRGILYSTTSTGGTGGPADTQGCGTVFAVDVTTEIKTVLHSFQNVPDGCGPNRLINVGGILYGSTGSGGISPDDIGDGTLFEITP